MSPQFFSDNRSALRGRLSESLVVMKAHTMLQRVNDTSYPFEQDSSFYYLTGITAPDWTLVMDVKSGEEWLIAPDVAEIHRIFDGSLSHDEASMISGVAQVISSRQGNALLRKLRQAHSVVGTEHDVAHRRHSFSPNPARARLTRQLKRRGFIINDIRQDITALRAVKQPAEIEMMRRAAILTVDAFSNAKRALPTLGTEYELQAEFDYSYKKAGMAHAYDPIVASGPRACTLHYIENSQQFPKNGLVVIDIGARVEGYCADVTRTYAIGVPSEREKAVHAAVERAHHDIIALLRPGLSVASYQETVDQIMQRELNSLGLLKKPSDYRKYFPHAISHGLGIDVHDSLGSPTHFKPGMVLTVEPGIYIPEEGIGVRIEDEILITDTGSENLTGALATSL